MNNELQLAIRDTLVVAFGKYLDSSYCHGLDLLGILKESLFVSDKLAVDSFSDNSLRELKDHLHNLRKLRNYSAHQSRPLTVDQERLKLLQIKDFIRFAREESFFSAASKKLDALAEMVEDASSVIELRASRPSEAMNPNVAGKLDAKSLADCLVLARKIALWFEDIQYAKTNKCICSLGDSERSLKTIWNLTDREEILRELENPTHIAAGELQFCDELLMLLTDIKSCVKCLAEELNDDYWEWDIDQESQTKSQASVMSPASGHIQSGMKEEGIRRALISLRERMIEETGINREDCVLKRSGLEAVVRYQIDSEEKLEYYLGDTFRTPDAINKQAPFFPSIFEAVRCYLRDGSR